MVIWLWGFPLCCCRVFIFFVNKTELSCVSLESVRCLQTKTHMEHSWFRKHQFILIVNVQVLKYSRCLWIQPSVFSLTHTHTHNAMHFIFKHFTTLLAIECSPVHIGWCFFVFLKCFLFKVLICLLFGRPAMKCWGYNAWACAGSKMRLGSRLWSGGS